MATDIEFLADKIVKKAFKDVSAAILKDAFPNLLRVGYFTMEELQLYIAYLLDNHKAGDFAAHLGFLYLMENMEKGKHKQ